jgi:hypothetical protein
LCLLAQKDGYGAGERSSAARAQFRSRCYSRRMSRRLAKSSQLLLAISIDS